MIVYGSGRAREDLAPVPPFVADLQTLPGFTDAASDRSVTLNQTEETIERVVLSGAVVIVDCSDLDRDTFHPGRMTAERAGVVPLRWGCPRVLLVTPGTARQIFETRQEPVHAWRLWRYQFDFRTDALVVGSPKRAARKIRDNIAAGRPWDDGFARAEVPA